MAHWWLGRALSRPQAQGHDARNAAGERPGGLSSASGDWERGRLARRLWRPAENSLTKTTRRDAEWKRPRRSRYPRALLRLRLLRPALRIRFAAHQERQSLRLRPQPGG